METRPLDQIVVEATSIHITMGDMEKNYQTMLSKIMDSVSNGVDLVVLPEMATCGYAVGDELEMDRFLSNNKKVVDRLIKDTKYLDIAIAMGYVDFEADKKGHDGKTRRYNSAVVFQKGEVKGVIHKNLLPTYTLFDEKRWFTPGTQLPVIEINVKGRPVKLGVGICEMKWAEDYVNMVDQNFNAFTNGLKEQGLFINTEQAEIDFGYKEKIEYANPALAFKDQGAELLVWLNASPFHAGKIHKIDAINKARVSETGLPLVDANFVGVGDNVYDLFGFSGESSVMGSDGEYISVTRPWTKESAVAKINLKTGLGEIIAGEEKRMIATNGNGFVNNYVDQIIDALVYMGGEFVKQTPCNGVLESMSGGIDSSVGTVLAYLAGESGAFEWLETYTFPTQYNTDTTKGMAHRVADNLGIELNEIPIQDEFVAKVKNYAKRVMSTDEYALAEEKFKEEGIDAFYSAFNNPVTPENIQARLRSEWMKVFSNEYNGVEWVNPNKDERRQGYTTLWGDMAGSLMILGDLDKWVVKAVAKRLNERMGREVIPEELIYDVNPSAELSDAQNPEKGGGDPFDYVALGIILDNYTFGRLDVPDIVEAFKEKRLDMHYCPQDEFTGESIYDKFTPDEFEKLTTQYITRNEIMRFKGVVAPLCPKVTRRAIGFELRTPVTSHYFRSAERRKEAGFY